MCARRGLRGPVVRAESLSAWQAVLTGTSPRSLHRAPLRLALCVGVDSSYTPRTALARGHRRERTAVALLAALAQVRRVQSLSSQETSPPHRALHTGRLRLSPRALPQGDAYA